MSCGETRKKDGLGIKPEEGGEVGNAAVGETMKVPDGEREMMMKREAVTAAAVAAPVQINT